MSSEGESEEFLSLEDEPSVINEKKPVLAKSPQLPLQPLSEEQIELLEGEIISEYAGTHQISWPLRGMDCPDCAMKAERALNRLAQTKTCSVSALDGKVKIEINLEAGTASQASSVLKSIGNPPDVEFFEVVGLNASMTIEQMGLNEREFIRVIKKQPGVLDVLIEENRVLLQLIPDSDERLLEERHKQFTHLFGKNYRLNQSNLDRLSDEQWRLIGAGLAMPVLISIILLELLSAPSFLINTLGIIGLAVGGFKMFREALATIMVGQLGYKVLTLLAVIGASILQAWEEALLVIILVAFAEHMENQALLRAREAMRGGLDRIPNNARRVEKKKSLGNLTVTDSKPMSLSMASTQQDQLTEISIEEVELGDFLEIRSGELIPADGKVVSGSGLVNTAPLTGESLPEKVGQGDAIFAGLVLARGPVTMEVEAVREATRLHGLIDSVHSFKEKPPRLQSSIELFTMIWVPIVLVGAVMAWVMFKDITDWKIVLLLWVVACPCALLLAAPIPHAAALSQAIHRGGIARGGDVLESLAKVNLALLDKTGTLTTGHPRFGELILGKNQRKDTVLKLAAGLEKSSNHPYAKLIIESCHSASLNPINVTDLIDGEDGVYGTYKGEQISMTKAVPDQLPEKLRDALETAMEQGRGASVLTRGKEPVALFTFIHDDVRPGVGKLIDDLFNSQVSIEVISGDHQRSVETFSQSLGLDKRSVHGDMKPEDKVKWVMGRSKTHITMMVGDGFNDAAAMAAADVGVAVGSGESTNLDAADILITGENPSVLSDLVKLSRKTRFVLFQNLAFSVLVTAVLVWSVLSGFNDNIVIGVLVHELSVIVVIFNGARLAGDLGLWNLLTGLFKNLYVDTIASFKQLFQNLFLTKESSTP